MWNVKKSQPITDDQSNNQKIKHENENDEDIWNTECKPLFYDCNADNIKEEWMASSVNEFMGNSAASASSKSVQGNHGIEDFSGWISNGQAVKNEPCNYEYCDIDTFLDDFMRSPGTVTNDECSTSIASRTIETHNASVSCCSNCDPTVTHYLAPLRFPQGPNKLSDLFGIVPGSQLFKCLVPQAQIKKEEPEDQPPKKKLALDPAPKPLITLLQSANAAQDYSVYGKTEYTELRIESTTIPKKEVQDTDSNQVLTENLPRQLPAMNFGRTKAKQEPFFYANCKCNKRDCWTIPEELCKELYAEATPYFKRGDCLNYLWQHMRLVNCGREAEYFFIINGKHIQVCPKMFTSTTGIASFNLAQWRIRLFGRKANTSEEDD